jgi:hypothetical protein
MLARSWRFPLCGRACQRMVIVSTVPALSLDVSMHTTEIVGENASSARPTALGVHLAEAEERVGVVLFTPPRSGESPEACSAEGRGCLSRAGRRTPRLPCCARRPPSLRERSVHRQHPMSSRSPGPVSQDVVCRIGLALWALRRSCGIGVPARLSSQKRGSQLSSARWRRTEGRCGSSSNAKAIDPNTPYVA